MKDRLTRDTVTPTPGSDLGVRVGTAGNNRGAQVDAVLYRSGQNTTIGTRAVAEFDSASLARVKASLPADLTHPDRWTDVGHAAIPNGLGNQTTEQVGELIAFWKPELEDFVERLGRLHRRWQRGNGQPGHIIIDGSLGGHAKLVVELVRLLAHRYPRAFLTVSLPIPTGPRARSWSRATIEAIQTAGADLIILQDDRVDAELHDHGYAYGLAGLLSGASAYVKHPVAANNQLVALAPTDIALRATGEQRRGLLVVQSSYAISLPAELVYHDDEFGTEYAIGASTLQTEVADGIMTMRRDPRHHSVGLLGLERMARTARLQIISANIGQQNQDLVVDKVVRGLRAADQLDFATELIFHRTREPQPADPADAMCELVVTEFETPADQEGLLDRIFADEASELIPRSRLVVSSTPVVTATPPTPVADLARSGSGQSASEVVFAFQVTGNGTHH